MRETNRKKKRESGHKLICSIFRQKKHRKSGLNIRETECEHMPPFSAYAPYHRSSIYTSRRPTLNNLRLSFLPPSSTLVPTSHLEIMAGGPTSTGGGIKADVAPNTCFVVVCSIVPSYIPFSKAMSSAHSQRLEVSFTGTFSANSCANLRTHCEHEPQI